ncbi:MAG TPA: DUF2461 family protein [Candidatus Acidoferrales bacterium]|jgi:uncharacterized protein (TIGR02453 family)|nr:DUF2461 family protein [Candidatus Acidoferrales bacterium]
MAAKGSIFSQETFRFFRELGRNNHKPWMDENRERYRAVLVEPLRGLLERLTPAARKLNPRFACGGRVGENFSRINRDIRFARDKSPYRTQMYLFFAEPEGGAQLYVGISADSVTCGFRVYSEGRTSPLVQVGRPRGRENPAWIARQKRRLAKYDSYWYATEKGEWAKRKGWPVEPDNWKKLQAWVVRRKFAPAVATRAGFEREIAKIFREVYPLYSFTIAQTWKAKSGRV